MLTPHRQKTEADRPIDFDRNWDQRGRRSTAKRSRARRLWSCCSWSCPPPVVAPLFSRLLEDSPSICLPSLHFPSRTHKLQRTETGKKWWVRRTREIRECVHTTTHLFQLLLCACVCVRVWSTKQTSDLSLILTHSVGVDVPWKQMCCQSLNEHPCAAAVSLYLFNTMSVITADVC